MPGEILQQEGNLVLPMDNQVRQEGNLVLPMDNQVQREGNQVQQRDNQVQQVDNHHTKKTICNSEFLILKP